MTSKFANKSFAPSAQQSSGEGGGGSTVDWKALNEHVAESVQKATDCEEGRVEQVVGIISGIVDYGLHQDPERVEPMDEGDAKTKEWKQKQVDKGKATVDEDGNFRFQAPPRQEVGFYVDFPQVIVDKGQFFGESNPAPYRVLLGGTFDGQPAQKTKVEGYPNENNVWVFGDRNRASKLATAAKLSGLKDGFAQDRLLELIGQAVVFDVEVYINSAGYLQEKVTNPSGVMKGIAIPEIDEDLLFYVGMNEDNDANQVKMLTKVVKEYIKAASNYEGSKLQKQLEALENDSKQQSPESNTNTQEKAKPSEKPVEKKETKTKDPMEPPIDFDDDNL
ncbi:hypothetical protein [Pseudoalteromonas phage PH357]|nr:hypothetical protein [Pseudoalteromonas phage PH357]